MHDPVKAARFSELLAQARDWLDQCRERLAAGDRSYAPWVESHSGRVASLEQTYRRLSSGSGKYDAVA